MALGDVIARLAVSLSLETAALEKGADLAEKRFAQSRKRFEQIGKQMQGIGKTLSVALTAPLAALGYGLVNQAKKLNDTAKEMKIASQVANESYEGFQRLAFGAKTVGIEADKLGDIFKDVQDKVGDFRATGGGGMADFFENIAPKVNVTAEAFKNLSGRDALQLYYDSLVKAGVSSDEMRFYMEAIASDATMLIPLLQDSGKAFDELGKHASVLSEQDAAGLQEYAIASMKFEAAMQSLTIAVVNSGLLEFVTNMVTRGTEWVRWLSEQNPELFKWGVAIGAVLAVIGPLLIGLGSLVKIGAPLLAFVELLTPALVLLGKAIALWFAANPVFLGLAAVITGIYLAWKNWDTIVAVAQRLYTGVKTWIMDKLGAVFNWLQGKIEAVKGFFKDLYTAVVGNSYIPDMVEGIGAEMRRLDALMVDPARKAAEKTADVFRDMAQEARGILDRLFPEVADRLEYERQRVVLKSAGAPEAALRALALERDEARRAGVQTVDFGERGGPLDSGIANLGQRLEALTSKAKDNTVRIAKSFKDMADDTLSALNRMTSAIQGGGFLGILEAVIGLGLQLGSIGAFGKTIAGRINATPRARGGPISAGRPYLVGERGPELVVPNHGGRVIPNNKLGGMGQLDIRPSPLFDVYLDGKLVQAAPAIAQAGAQIAGQRLAYSNSRRWR